MRRTVPGPSRCQKGGELPDVWRSKVLPIVLLGILHGLWLTLSNSESVSCC